MKILFELIYNFGILISISIISGFIGYRDNNGWKISLSQGLIFGMASLIGMINPLVIVPGLIFDGRSVMISLSGLFFGPLASVVSALMALVFRIYQGGTGVIVGSIVIIMSANIGTVFHIINKRRNNEITISSLFLMGIFVHITMIALMLLLPDNKGVGTIKLIGLPVLIIYPIATVLIGRILLEVNEYKRMVEELRKQFQKLKINNELLIESENQLNRALDNAPIPIMLRAEDGEVIKISRKWTEITGYTILDIPTINDWTTKAYGYDKLRIQELIMNSYNTNSPMDNGEYKIITADGKVIIWDFNVANIGKSSDGRKVIMSAATDVTERKFFEETLKASEEKYRLITEQASDVIWVMNYKKRRYIYISPSVFNLTGFTAQEAMNQSLEETMTPESLVVSMKNIEVNINNFIKNSENSNSYIYEIQQPCKNGDIIWVEVSTKYRYDANGDIEIIGVSRNVNERKKSENEVLYLSFHDQLTGLYNRRFYEEELIRLDTKRNLPLTIVMGDVNGLKLINDSFGHTMGDELLKKAAEVFRNGFRSDDIIARHGGDEFVVLLPKTDALETEQIIKRVRNLSLKEKVGLIDISISFGYETKNSEKDKIQEVFKKAEDNMYNSKLFERPSIRGSKVDTILKTLHEKNKREEQHSQRVSILCEKMAEVLGLSQQKINELKTVGLLHDIGKIALDENILNKPGKLTEKEWNEIKRHPEIGYRILSTVKEMSEMAEYVLSHHERWDGKGYPRGLKGEEIPIESRIIAIVDAYDALISERAYKKELSKEEALKEIIRCSGQQFDSKIAYVFVALMSGEYGH